MFFKSNRKGFMLLAMLLCFCILCFGCAKPRFAKPAGQPLYTLTDATGTAVAFMHKPQRIVSLSISTDEILLDLVAAKRIVALTTYVDDVGISNAVVKAKAVQGRVQPGSNPEGILALKADVILLRSSIFFEKKE